MLLSKHFITDPRVQKEAETLHTEKNDITVIVWDRKNKLKSEEIVDGISVNRIHNTFLMNILPNIIRVLIWWRKAYKKGLELYKGGFNFEVVHCHDLDTLQTGVWLKKKTGCKLIYDAHEIFGYMIENSAPKFVVKYAFKMENKLIKNIDRLITVDSPFKKYFSSITKKPITVVMNCKNLIYNNYEPKKNDIFTLIYIGGMSNRRFFPDIVDLVGNIPGVRFMIAGLEGWLFEEVKERCKQYDNMDFLGTILSDDILPLTRKADTSYMVVDPSSKQNELTAYNKQFEAMVCGTPIICTKGTYAGEMTEELNCGLTVDYTEESIKQAIIKLRDNPDLREKLGRNAFDAAKKRYNWGIEKKKLLKVYEEMT
jgi:glycosyltransferase involved in cell wall biosynthesis